MQAADGAPKPGPEHQKLQVWVGDWDYEGEYQATPFGPAGKYKGKESAKMILNGFFVEDHWQERSEGGSLGEGKIIIGYDPGKKAYVDYMISNDGQTGSTTSTVNGSVWTGTGSQTDSNGKVYRTRHVRTVSSDGRTVTIKAEYSADRGKTWLRWWEQVGRKVN